jgi:hypothetical protein
MRPRPTLADLLALARTPHEQAFVRARVEGLSKTAQAEALGLQYRPPADQTREIDRTLKRLRQRARRAHGSQMADR